MRVQIEGWRAEAIGANRRLDPDPDLELPDPIPLPLPLPLLIPILTTPASGSASKGC